MMIANCVDMPIMIMLLLLLLILILILVVKRSRLREADAAAAGKIVSRNDACFGVVCTPDHTIKCGFH
jgi:hypothetical protein